MSDWTSVTLFIYIVARMSGFILMNPLFGRSNFPAVFKAGTAFLLSVSVYSIYSGTVAIPATTLEFGVRILLEVSLGFLVSVVMHIFFYIPELVGRVIDEQMGMSMASTYDAGAQTSLTTSASLLNAMQVLLFFAANGHLTLLHLMMTSGELVPFGAAALGDDVANRVIAIFIECTLLALKMCLPILAAELMGQVGMGILMKVIPQINVFAINIELKVLIGLAMMLMLLSPFSQYFLEIESKMLTVIGEILRIAI